MGAQVRAAVPDPGDGYADLSNPRWAGLQEFFAPRRQRRARRASRWLRVLAPVAVALVAVAVGLAVITDRERRSGQRQQLRACRRQDAGARPAAARPEPATPPAAQREAQSRSLGDQLDVYGVVVLAKAQAVSGAFQRFVIVKVLKGEGPDAVRLRVADRPADEGRLHLLFLHPRLGDTARASAEPALSPLPEPGRDNGRSGRAGRRRCRWTYRYQGETAVVRELPAGTDPAAVVLQ